MPSLPINLQIGGNDFSHQRKQGSEKIVENIQNQGNTLTVSVTKRAGQNTPIGGQTISMNDVINSRTLFNGYVTKITPQEYGIGNYIIYKVEAMDHTYVLANKEAQESYENMTLGAIVADLLTNIDAGYGITGTNVAAGPVISTINFNHISIRQCFENLAKLTGYIWWIDYAKDVHFIDPTGGVATAPEKITDTSGNHESIAIHTDVTQVKNDIIVLGGTQESANYPQVIVGDGSAREWLLLYPVQTMVSVELSLGGGAYVAQTFGIDPKDDETLFYSMYSPDRGSIRLSSGSTTLGATDKLRVTFTYPIPVITEVQSPASILAMKNIEGGDGIHKATINDSTIVSLNQATQRALQEIDQFADPILSGEVITRTGLLQAGSHFSPGQSLTVNLPSWGINTDTVYIIQRVTTTIDQNGSSIEYHYDITFGGRLLGVVDFLLALATPESPLDTSGEINKIYALSDVVSIVETITRNGNLQTLSESISIVETSLTHTNTTPPFKWAPSATKKAVWNKFEWG